MNLKTSKLLQFVLGFGSISILWVAGYLSSDPFNWLLDKNISDLIWMLFDFISAITPFLISLCLIALSIVGKKHSYKILYYSALTAVCLPVIAYVFSLLMYDDSSAITWLLMPVAIILYPLGFTVLTIDNAAFNLGGFWEREHIVVIMTVLIFASLVIYKKIKTNNDDSQEVK